MQDISPVELDFAVKNARAQAAIWHPPRAREQLRIDASALLATLKLPADVEYVNVALNPLPDIFGFPTGKYATTVRELEDVGRDTGGITNGQTSPLEPKAVYYDLRAIHVSARHGDRGASVQEVLAHETVHLAQYADLQRAGKDPIRETVRANLVNDYQNNPVEVDAFKRAPALAHLVKVNDH